MIKINKSTKIPSVLSTQGKTATTELCDEYNASPSAYTSQAGVSNKGVKKFNFDSKIYGHKDVKRQLILEQHEKCCFCESVFNATGYGDVEHFRPKAAYKVGGKLNYPAYYWLAYEWSNLMFSCQVCNQKFKGNHFPLLDGHTRVKSHDDTNTIADEAHTLINPIEEDPEYFIDFNEEVPRPKSNLSPHEKKRATETIRIFGLDRPQLNRDRRDYLKTVQKSEFISKIPFDKNNADHISYARIFFPSCSIEEVENIISEAKETFMNAAKEDKKFAGMVRANFPMLDR